MPTCVNAYIAIGLLLLMSLTFFTTLAHPDAGAKGPSGKNRGGQNSIQICCAWGTELADGKLTYKIKGGDSDIRDSIRSAIGQWDLKIGGLTLQELKNTQSSADITIDFKKDGSSLTGDRTKHGLMTAGLTAFTLNRRGLIENAHVTLAKGVAGRDFSSNQLELVAKHEIGHALGLGHSNFRESIMSPTISNHQSGIISECEINGVLSANAWKLIDDNSTPHSATDRRVNC